MRGETISSRRAKKVLDKKCACERDFEAVLKSLTEFLLR